MLVSGLRPQRSPGVQIFLIGREEAISKKGARGRTLRAPFVSFVVNVFVSLDSVHTHPET